MFSRLREPFGKAGLIVAIVALVAALTGGAYAAGKLTSKQKKEVEKIAKKFQGTGPAGAQGPAGANGKDGANGANGEKGGTGEKGANGTGATTTSFSGKKTVGSVTCNEGGVEVKSASPTTAVCNGTTGFTKTLPPGETETGYWNLNESSGALTTVSTAISFPIPLAKGGAEHSAFGFSQEETENEEFGTSGCKGSASEPTAPPGVLCVYTAEQFEEEELEEHPSLRSFQNGEKVEFSYGSSGAELFRSQPLPKGEFLNAWGTWAVTAPTAP
jgi:hypothetical protein